MTHKNSRMFEKIMYKVNNKSNKEVYRIRDFTSGDKVDLNKFVESVSQRGERQMQTSVCVLYKDEYISLIEEIEPLKREVKDLKTNLNDKEIQIKKLEGELKTKTQSNSDEVMQLKEEKFNMTQDHQKELEDLKEKHANQLLAIDETHQKEIEKLNEQYIAKLDKANDKLLTEVQGNKQASDNLRDEMLTMKDAHKKAIDTLHQEKSNLEITHSNEMLELEKIHHAEVKQLSEELSQVKQDHLKKINEKEQAHNDEREQIRNSFLNLITNVNSEDIREIKSIERDVPSIFKPFMKKHMRKLEDLKERKQANTPERIVKAYELGNEKEKK